ncbi:MAG: 50S ribosomal protein L3 [bacterium]
MNALVGLKKDMTRVFAENNKSVAVTLVSIKGCIKAKNLNGATYIGIGKQKAGKNLDGQFKDLGYVPAHVVTVEGDVDVNIDEFNVNDVVIVKGVTKGKGFQGVVKRWGFAGGPKTHGQSDKLRHPGSNGSGTTPGRVWKGKKMGGRMGTDNVTIKNVKVMAVDKENGIIALSGPIPGGRNSVVTIIKK